VVPSHGNAEGAAYQVSSAVSSDDLLYYRLSQIDRDGTKKEFHSVLLQCGNEQQLQFEVFPVPVDRFLNVLINSGKETGQMEFSIENALGATVHREQVSLKEGVTQWTVEVDFEPGIYFVKFRDNNNVLQSKKVI